MMGGLPVRSIIKDEVNEDWRHFENSGPQRLRAAEATPLRSARPQITSRSSPRPTLAANPPEILKAATGTDGNNNKGTADFGVVTTDLGNRA